MMRVNRSPFTIAIMALAVTIVSGAARDAGAADGKAVFEAQKCGACHIVSGPVEPVPIAERAAIKGPPLWFAGSKFKPGWLAGWLAAPTPIRRVKYLTLEKGSNDHVALSATDAGAVADYLMTLTDPEMPVGAVADSKLNRRKRFKAEKLFAKHQVCFGCHQYPSRRGNIGGFTGPSLVGAGARLNPDWIIRQIQDPQRFHPNGRMPVYGDQAFNGFTEEELKLIAQYIGGM